MFVCELEQTCQRTDTVVGDLPVRELDVGELVLRQTSLSAKQLVTMMMTMTNYDDDDDADDDDIDEDDVEQKREKDENDGAYDVV